MLLKASTAALLLLLASAATALARRPLKVSSVKVCTTLVLGSFYTEECEGCGQLPGCTVTDDPIKNCSTFSLNDGELRYLYDCDDVANAPATQTLPRGLLTREYLDGLPSGRVAELEPVGHLINDADTGAVDFDLSDFEVLNQDIPWDITCYGVNNPDYKWGQVSAKTVANVGELAYEGQAQSASVNDAAGLAKKGRPLDLNMRLAGRNVGFKTQSTDGKREVVIDDVQKKGYVLLSIVGKVDYDEKGYNMLKESEIQYYKRYRSHKG